MHKIFSLSIAVLLLASCAKTPVVTTQPKTPTLEENLQNPLFAERYWTELTERMASLVINKDPILKDSAKAKRADATRIAALAKEDALTKQRGQSLFSGFVAAAEQTDGYAMLKDNMLYLSTDFATYPGSDLHLYVTSVVDPRDKAFPDSTALDLGVLQSPYGAQAYEIKGETGSLAKLGTVVLYDKDLGRIYAFAQLGRMETTPAQTTGN